MEFDQDKSALLYRFYAMLLEIDVAKEGVIMAKNFFEAKVDLTLHSMTLQFLILFSM